MSYTGSLFFDFYQVRGDSMKPFLKNGQTIILLNCSMIFVNCSFHENDVITFKLYNELYIKRVAIKPDSRIDYENGSITLEFKGEVIETYLESWHFKYLNEKNCEQKDSKEFNFLIPSHKYFVLGDNLIESEDSRSFGLISEAEIVGKLILIL